MSKKILSLALVVVMLMSTFALTAFAASGPLSSVGIKVVSDATVGMEAGEEVTVKVYFTVPEGADTSDYLHNMSNVVIAYTDAFELNTATPDSTESADARTWGASYADYISDVNSLVNSKVQLYTNYSKVFTDNDTAKGWDGLVLVQQAFAQTATTGYAIDPDCEVFSLSFITKRKVEATDSFGVPECTVTKGYTKMTYITTAGKNAQYTKSLDTITLAEAVAYPEAKAAEPEVVALDDTMARMDDWTKAESTNTFDGGLIGQINNLELTFTQEGDRLQCDQIESIEVYANGKKMGNAYQVYKVDDTTYQFRAVILGMDKTADTYETDVEYEFKVALKGDYAGTTLTAKKTVSAKAIFTEAYNAYKTVNP